MMRRYVWDCDACDKRNLNEKDIICVSVPIGRVMAYEDSWDSTETRELCSECAENFIKFVLKLDWLTDHAVISARHAEGTHLSQYEIGRLIAKQLPKKRAS